MKLSTRIRYAIRFLLYVAAQQADSPVAISSIADEECLSVKYLEQIVASLKSSDLVTSERGKAGGYRLARKAEDILMLEVFQAMDEDVELVPCIDEAQCDRTKECLAREFWEDFNAYVKDYLASRTLQDLLDKNSSL